MFDNVFSEEELVLFSGGMQRSVHSDRHTVTVKREGKGKKHVVFDISSKVIDFFTILPSQKQEENDEEKDEKAKKVMEEPEALIILAEEEIIAIDLTDPDWKMMKLPYLVSLHDSTVC